MNEKITCLYHRNDFDGLFCGQIANKFLPGCNLIGWHFGDPPVVIPAGTETVYVMDLPCDQPFGHKFTGKVDNETDLLGFEGSLIWIDHHKSAIESHPKDIPGYRIDGVAACRLAWQWFSREHAEASDGTNYDLPKLDDYRDRNVIEPLAVRLAGEYDIWDKRDPNAELFQHGLRSRDLDGWWDGMLCDEAKASLAEVEGLIDKGREFSLMPNGNVKIPGLGERIVCALLKRGEAIAFTREQEYKTVITEQGFDVVFDGITFLACNSHGCDIRSQLFEAGIKPHHQALLGFTFTGHQWRVSMYQIEGKKDVDVLSIAKKFGGGGHPGACGFMAQLLPFWQIANKETVSAYLDKCYGILQTHPNFNKSVASNIVAMMSP